MIEISQPEIQDCGHAHFGPCPFESDYDSDEFQQHRDTSCGSYICCIN